MPTTDRILTWTAIAQAGIDADRISRDENPQDTSLELYSAASVSDPSLRLVFGEYHDRTEGGWDSLVYERVGDDGDYDWQSVGAPGYYETPAELLAAVKEWLAEN